MSQHFDHNERYKELAFMILQEINAIRFCDIHDDWYYSTGMDKATVYAVATNKLKEKERDPDFTLFHSYIQTILAEAGSSASDCPFCEKLMRD